LEAVVPTRSENLDRPFSATEVAQLLGLHRLTVYEAAHRGDLPCFRVGRRYFFPREAITRLLSGERETRRVP
jgi:excisionase family DNA binding protein